MSASAPGEHLSDNQHLTLLLRLVVDAQGQLVHGELAELDGTADGKFQSLEALLDLLASRLANHA